MDQLVDLEVWWEDQVDLMDHQAVQVLKVVLEDQVHKGLGMISLEASLDNQSKSIFRFLLL